MAELKSNGVAPDKFSVYPHNALFQASMFSLKYLAFLLGVLVFLSASSLAEEVSDPSQDLATNKAGEELEVKDLEEKLFLSTNTSSTSTTVSGAGIVWLLLWGVVFSIIGSAVLCYWVGCEYASTGRRLNNFMGLYVVNI